MIRSSVHEISRALTRLIVLLVLVPGPSRPSAECVIVTDYHAEEFPDCGHTTGVHDTMYEYCPRAEGYNCPGGDLGCETQLVPTSVIEVGSPSSNFQEVLVRAFPQSDGWDYRLADGSLSCGSLIVHTYDAGRASCMLHIEYLPNAGDPQEQIHWIQVVTDNHNETDDPGHGNLENVVDTPWGTGTTPYYDDGACAEGGDCNGVSGCGFFDVPNRLDSERSHGWIAETFLVQGPDIGDGPGTITFYTPGFQWGWLNLCDEDEVLDYTGEVDGFAQAESQGPIVPGAVLECAFIGSPSMTLSKGGVTASVTLTSANLTIEIDAEVDRASGNSAFQVVSGSGTWEAYLFGDIPIGASTFSIEEGSGWIKWRSGEITCQIKVRVQVAGFDDIVAVAQGSGLIESNTTLVTIDPDAKAVEQVSKPTKVQKLSWGRIKILSR